MGIEREEYERTFLMPFDPLEKVMAFYRGRGLTAYADGRWHLTPQGMLVSNQLIGQLIDAQTNPPLVSPSFLIRKK